MKSTKPSQKINKIKNSLLLWINYVYYDLRVLSDI